MAGVPSAQDLGGHHDVVVDAHPTVDPILDGPRRRHRGEDVREHVAADGRLVDVSGDDHAVVRLAFDIAVHDGDAAGQDGGADEPVRQAALLEPDPGSAFEQQVWAVEGAGDPDPCLHSAERSFDVRAVQPRREVAVEGAADDRALPNIEADDARCARHSLEPHAHQVDARGRHVGAVHPDPADESEVLETKVVGVAEREDGVGIEKM